jgi:hypothetical protein
MPDIIRTTLGILPFAPPNDRRALRFCLQDTFSSFQPEPLHCDAFAIRNLLLVLVMATTTVTIDPTTSSTGQTEPCSNDTSFVSPLEPATIDTNGPNTPSLRPSLTWKSIRSTFSVSEKTSAQLGWAVALLSLLLTIAALSPTFRSQTASERALKLAEWTALKDYVEECREEMAAGLQSQGCLRATNVELPPPPYVKAGLLERTRRGVLSGGRAFEFNATSGGLYVQQRHIGFPKALLTLFLVAILLTAWMLVFSNLNGRRARLYRRPEMAETEEKELDKPTLPLQPQLQDPTATSTTTIRYPPPSRETNLRRRREIRTHPIYRHANLEEAIHHEDLPEIKTRLMNGEDVNKHWPYLIYKLALTPPSPSTSKRLDIARLCLDFGADVNAGQGWNGQSALVIAIHFGNVEVAKMLIANGARDTARTALHHCARLAVTGSASDALTIMQALFDHGADAHVPDRLGETPLHKLLIDAWFSRHDEAMIKKLYPVALSLVMHGARLPTTIKEKHVVGNPLWELVSTEIWDEWPEQVGPVDSLVVLGRRYAARRREW